LLNTPWRWRTRPWRWPLGFRHLLVEVADDGAIFWRLVGDDHEVRLPRRSAKHLGAEARISNREADIDIISMAQQASPKVMAKWSSCAPVHGVVERGEHDSLGKSGGGIDDGVIVDPRKQLRGTAARASPYPFLAWKDAGTHRGKTRIGAAPLTASARPGVAPVSAYGIKGGDWATNITVSSAPKTMPRNRRPGGRSADTGHPNQPKTAPAVSVLPCRQPFCADGCAAARRTKPRASRDSLMQCCFDYVGSFRPAQRFNGETAFLT